MPCCHRDLRTANQMQIVSKSLGVSKSGLIDVARLGAIVARGFDCRWRTIDKSITPENRILVGLARPKVSEQVRSKERYHCTTYRTPRGCAMPSPPTQTPYFLTFLLSAYLLTCLLAYLRRKAAAWQLRHAAIGKQSDARLSHIYARIHGMARDPYAPSPAPE